MYDLIVKNGKLVSHDRIFKADICIKDGKYAAFIENGEDADAKNTIDAKGKFIFPGIIDCHVHLNEPGFTWREDFKTGTRAAAAGGTTTLIDMPLNNDPPLTNKDVFNLKYRTIKEKALVDYGLWGGLIDNNLDDLVDLHGCGVAAFKGFVCPMGDNPFTSVKLEQVKEALELLKPHEAVCGFHCEDYSMILEAERMAQEQNLNSVRDFLNAHSVLSECVATKDIIDLARVTGGRVHICHISHPLVAQIVKDAIAEGLQVTGETCPHYLAFTEDFVTEKGALAKCTPPMRTKAAAQRLWDYVLDGTISCIGSDHSPATAQEKDDSIHTIWSAWGGLNSIQFFLPLMFDLVVHQKEASPTLIAQTMGYNPARLFKLYGRKGAFEVGFDGDIVILDPDKEWTLSKETTHTMNVESAFEGVKGKGFPTHTIIRGQVVAKDGIPESSFGYGEFIRPVLK